MKYCVQDKHEWQMPCSLPPNEFWFTTNLYVDPASPKKPKGQGSMALRTVQLVPVTCNLQESFIAASTVKSCKKNNPDNCGHN